MALVAEAPNPVEDVAQLTAQPTAQPKRRRLRRWLLCGLLVLLLPLCALGIWAKVTFDRIERDAHELAVTGTTLKKFLKTYTAHVKEKDINA